MIFSKKQIDMLFYNIKIEKYKYTGIFIKKENAMPPGKPNKYLSLAENIRRLTEIRNLKNGDPLPSERQLAELFSCNHLTVRKALRLLEQDRLIHKVPSRGNYMGRKPPEPGESNLAAFLFPDDEVYYYSLFASLEKEFSAMNLHLLVHLTNSNEAKERAILSSLDSLGVQAVISVPNPQCADAYRKLGIPVVFLDTFPMGSDFPFVMSDNRGGALAAVEYLCSLGHRRIAHIGFSYDRTSELRRAGFLEALERHRIPLPGCFDKRQGSSREWGFYAARELFESGEAIPSAVFCDNDTIAAGVVRYCSEKGIPIPGALSVIGFGNTQVAEDLNLTSVSQNPVRIAERLTSLIHRLLRGETIETGVTLPVSLVLRKSCSACPSGF